MRAMNFQLLRIARSLGIVVAVAIGTGDAATAADDPCKPSGAIVTGVSKLGDESGPVELGDKIAVALDKPAAFIAEALCRKKSIVLYVNGQPTANRLAGRTGPQSDVLVFFLRPLGATREVWNILLGWPDFQPREIRLSVGIEEQPPLPLQPDKTLNLTVLPIWCVLFWAATFLILVFGFFRIARNSTILRDQLIEPKSPQDLGAYSLSKFQGAWWFFIILASYLLIGIVTGDFSNTISSTAVILLGIGAGTVLGSAAIDASKLEQRKTDLKAAKAQLIALNGVNPPDQDAIDLANAKIEALNGTSVGWLQDILSDGNGVNFHRFQLAAWTIVLSIVFAFQVYAELAMPVFNTTLMSLLGLSAGTFLGLKIPEPTKPTG
jgi:hypothetical protein